MAQQMAREMARERALEMAWEMPWEMAWEMPQEIAREMVEGTKLSDWWKCGIWNEMGELANHHSAWEMAREMAWEMALEIAREIAWEMAREMPWEMVSVIMKNQKNGFNSSKMCPRAKVQITDPPKVGSPVFEVLTEMENWCLSL